MAVQLNRGSVIVARPLWEIWDHARCLEPPSLQRLIRAILSLLRWHYRGWDPHRIAIVTNTGLRHTLGQGFQVASVMELKQQDPWFLKNAIAIEPNEEVQEDMANFPETLPDIIQAYENGFSYKRTITER